VEEAAMTSATRPTPTLVRKHDRGLEPIPSPDRALVGGRAPEQAVDELAR